MSTPVKIMVGVVTAVIITGILLVYFMGPFKDSLGTVKPDRYQPEGSIYQDSIEMDNLQNRKPPDIKAKNGFISVDQTIDVMDYLISVTDADGKDLISLIKIQGDLNNNIFSSDVSGTYNITYSVTDSHGLKAEKSIVILVNDQKGGAS